MHARPILSTVTVWAGAWLLSCGVAQAVPTASQLVFTENSSVSLTVTLNGSSSGINVNLSSPDFWIVSFPSTDLFNGRNTWIDPNAAALPNEVLSELDSIAVNSESLLSGNLSNGAVDTTDFTLNGQEVDVTFNDNGDTITRAPDATSTLPLLGLSVAGLGILAKRLRSKRVGPDI